MKNAWDNVLSSEMLEVILKKRQLINQISFMVLIFILPFSHTMTLRLLAIFIPPFFWLMEFIVKRNFKFKRTALDLPVLFLLVWGLLSTIFSVDIKYSFKEYRTDMLIGFLLLYSSINNIEKKMVEKIIDALAIGAAVVSIYGILEYIGITGYIKLAGRADSVAPDSIYLSTYLILVLPLVLYKFHTATTKMRVLYAGLILLLIGILGLNFSRAAWIVGFIELVLWGIFLDRRMLIFLLVILIVGIIGLNMTSGHRFSEKSIMQNYRDTDVPRIKLWEFGIIHLKDRPILGFGYGRANFVRTYPELLKEDGHFFHAHNTFINIGLELGIPGLIALLWLFWAILKSLWKDWKDKMNEKRFLSFAILISVVGFLIRVQFDHLLVDEMALMLWLLAGIGFVISNPPSLPFSKKGLLRR